MGIEIERKFLVRDLSAVSGLTGIRMRQGYLSVDPERTVRVRLAGPRAYLIEKTRYRVSVGRLVWEIDVFSGENEGLVVAEVELPSEVTAVVLPDWVGEEVTGDDRYYNASLVSHPYREWGRA
jgi:CYTH domain-containing protein